MDRMWSDSQAELPREGQSQSQSQSQSQLRVRSCADEFKKVQVEVAEAVLLQEE